MVAVKVDAFAEVDSSNKLVCFWVVRVAAQRDSHSRVELPTETVDVSERVTWIERAFVLDVAVGVYVMDVETNSLAGRCCTKDAKDWDLAQRLTFGIEGTLRSI